MPDRLPAFNSPALPPVRSQRAPVSTTSVHDPRNAIADAARRTGTDFDYLLAQAKLESGLNPNAKARTSSASGLFQFIDSTWIDTIGKHGSALGLGAATTGASRSQIMALRFDPHASSLMAGALANDNRAILSGVLGREPDHAELYMAHFLGAGGASKFLRQLQQDPEISAAAILPAPAAANRAIFYNSGGAARSVGDVMEVMRGKMARAIGGNAADQIGGAMPHFVAGNSAPGSGHHSRTHTSPLHNSIELPTRPVRSTSMADTLRSSFAIAGDAMPVRAREQVHSAYAKLRAFDL
ncbi:MAG: transglycosylase SLT domain-containing protein [Pontixanthobacter sp.]